MKNTGKTLEIKSAPLYSILGRVRNEELNVRIIPLTRAKQKGDVWSYPADVGTKTIENKSIGTVQVCDFGNNNIVYNGFCTELGISKLFKLVKSTYNSHFKSVSPIIKEVKVPVITKIEAVIAKIEVAPVVKTISEIEVIITKNENAPIVTKVFSKRDQEDIDAVNAILSGKKEHFSILYKRYYAIINFKYSSSLKFNKDLADDLTADLFVKVYEKLHKYKPTFTFNSWISRFATNFLIDYTRKKSLNTISLDAGFSNEKMRNEDTEFAGSFDAKDNELNPEEILITGQKNVLVGNAINSLSDNCRITMEKRFLEEKSYNDIAIEMGVSVNTIKSNIFRSKAKLKTIVETNKNILESVLS